MASDMKTITVKHIPEELYRRLKKSASRHRRSLNSEVLVTLEQALSSVPFEPQAFLASVRAMREGMRMPPVSDEEISVAKTQGRRL
jgi:antitoxin FitA